jgi:multiple sugar transport system permease protein
MWPLIIVSDQRKYTLPVAIANLVGEHVQDLELMMASSVMTVIAGLVLFPCPAETLHSRTYG